MVFTFDSLAYAKHLRDHGVPQQEAEAHAEAARTFIMNELITKEDLRVGLDDLRRGLDEVRRDLDAKIENLSLRMDAAVVAAHRAYGRDVRSRADPSRRRSEASLSVHIGLLRRLRDRPPSRVTPAPCGAGGRGR